MRTASRSGDSAQGLGSGRPFAAVTVAPAGCGNVAGLASDRIARPAVAEEVPDVPGRVSEHLAGLGANRLERGAAQNRIVGVPLEHPVGERHEADGLEVRAP